ncbi:MAG: DUF4115 domain-containing protein [Anaerolineales bacterium]|nr:DUF4115 domain-containing protein [Anaerolineales bacterium]
MSDFASLGNKFREAREARELNLQQVEKQTRIRLKYLQAIESGHFQLIDTPIQLEGFLRKYARTLGLDEASVMAEYQDALHGKKRRKKAVTTQPRTTNPTIVNVPGSDPTIFTARQTRRFKTGMAVLLSIGLTAAIIGGIVLTLNDLATGAPTPDINDQIEILDNSSSRITATPTQPQFPTPVNTPVINPSEGLIVRLSVEQRLWVRITSDGVVVYEGMLLPGYVAEYTAVDELNVKTSNAGGLRLYVNNQPYALGTERVTAEQTFTRLGILTPTVNPLSPSDSATTTELPPAAASITATLTSTPSPEGELPTSIPIPAFSTNTFTPSPTVPLPTLAPTLPPTALLPPRVTSTPTLAK